MVVAALALVAVGIVLGILAPPFGFAPVAVGILLILLYAFAGIGRKVAD